MCEYKELIDKGVCDRGFIWNHSNYECECDKSCDVGQYVDYKNCKGRKKLVDKLVKECTETVEEVKIAKITFSKNENKCCSCTLYIVLFSAILSVNIGIGTSFVNFYWYLKRNVLSVSLVLVLKQQFIKFSFIKIINGKSQTN